MTIIDRTDTETIAALVCRAWTGYPAQIETVRILDGEVTVYDGVAGHYTRCHGLSAATQRRIIRSAAKSR